MILLNIGVTFQSQNLTKLKDKSPPANCGAPEPAWHAIRDRVQIFDFATHFFFGGNGKRHDYFLFRATVRAIRGTTFCRRLVFADMFWQCKIKAATSLALFSLIEETGGWSGWVRPSSNVERAESTSRKVPPLCLTKVKVMQTLFLWACLVSIRILSPRRFGDFNARRRTKRRQKGTKIEAK